MAEERSTERSCNFGLALFRYGGVNTSYNFSDGYDAKAGQKREFVLSGLVDDPSLDGGPSVGAFSKKPVRVEISSPPNPDWLREVLGAPNADNACGLVQVDANVEPRQFELDGEIIEEEPVKVMLTVGAEMFEALRLQAVEAYRQRRIMHARVALIGASLPQKESHFIFLEDLDVSTGRVYAVGGFEIFDTRFTDHLRGRVIPIKHDSSEGYGTSISVLLAEARCDVSMERGLVYGISCEGRIINAKGQPYDSADVTIEFHEFERGTATDELPERAYFGEFGYWPKPPNKESSSAYFSLQLRHIHEDVHSVLISLLTQDVGTQVVLNVDLKVEQDELLGVTDKLWGNVRYYSFEVRRNLINNA